MPKLESINVLVTGTYASGKTSFIKAVSELDTISTMIQASSENRIKDYYLDFGRLTIEEGHRYFYFFAHANNYLIPPIDTWVKPSTDLWRYQLVYLLIVDSRTVDNEGHDHTPEIKAYLKTVQESDTPYLLLANKRQDVPAYSLTEMRMRLDIPQTIPFLECDPVSNPASARQVLVELFKLLPQDDLILAAIEKLEE